MDQHLHGISSWICRCLSLVRSLAVHSGRGFRLPEVWADACHPDPRLQPDMPAFARQARECGCRVHSLHAPFTDLGVQPVELPRRTFDYAAELGAGACVVHLPKAQPVGPETTTENLDGAKRFVESILEPAEKAGVQISLENPPRKRNPEYDSTLASLVREFPDPGIDFCIDVGRVLINGADMGAEIAAAGRLSPLHLSSNDTASYGQRPAARGALDWPRTRSAFSCVGYDGPRILEIQGGDDPVGVLREMPSDPSIA